MAEAVRGRVRSSDGDLNRSSGSDLEEQAFQEIKKNHDKTHADVKLALNYDERGLLVKAIEFYQRALKAIAKGLSFNLDGSEHTGDRWEQAKKLQEKMRKTAHQIKSRLEALEKEFRPLQTNQEQSSTSHGANVNGSVPQTNGRNNTSVPPPYEIDPATRGWSEREARELSMNMSIERDLNDICEPPSYEETMEDAYEIYGIAEGVQIYFISSAGYVSAPSYPSNLKIYKFFDEEKVRVTGQPPAFLQVGEWLYPLVPGRSPALRSDDGAYIFPDCESPDRGACVGVIIPPNLSSTKLKQFQDTIKELTALRTQSSVASGEAAATRPAERRPAISQEERMDEGETEDNRQDSETSISTTIAKGIETGASWLSWGLGKGAVLGGNLISKGAGQLKKHIKPSEEPKEVDEKYQKGVHYARKATGAVVTVSGVVIDGLCYMTTKLGEVAAPVIREQTDKLIKKGDDGQENGKWSKAAYGVAEVAGSGLVGFGVIYSSLESAAKSLAKSIHNSTVQVVQHRYGDDAAKLTDNSMATVGNVGVSVYNFKNLGVKAIAKRTAKDTGKALVKEYQSDKQQPKNDDLNLL
ncbi:Spartin [Holothuria leucospilota]|uniref:Spartin n=1 Tax=Holothuria leucospilota TaxID=206669 RepID=A0A9Q1GZ92_HOLLE|nr:Spartin [Holothuria leucospilota]